MTATQEYFAEKLKLWTGMFLMFYCVTHYLNHSIGIFGLDAVEYIRNIFLFFWRNTFMNFFLPGVAVIHIYLSLSRVIRIASFRGFRRHEWFQLIAGILTVPAVALHVTGTKIALIFYGIDDTYTAFSVSIVDYIDIFIFYFLNIKINLLFYHIFFIYNKKYINITYNYNSYKIHLPWARGLLPPPPHAADALFICTAFDMCYYIINTLIITIMKKSTQWAHTLLTGRVY